MNFPDRGDVDALIDPQPLPDFVRVQYEPATAAVDDPPAAVQVELDRLDFDELESGATVAVAVGSRGIHRIDDIAAAVVAAVRDRGFEPVVVPAMGSHGGATPEGQREVLESLGITESRLDTSIDARMNTAQVDSVTLGDTEFLVHVSTAAQEADAVVVVNRVKPHTNYSGRIESGLTKMTVVGLGKQHGAKAFHSTAIKQGYVETLEAAVPVVEAALPLVGGVALVENFHEKTAHVEAIPAGSFTDREPALLEQAYDEMATLPVNDIDLLVVDELGKDVSGAGMDTNVIGRYRVLNAPDPDEPSIKLLYARGLTEATKGNGNGIGLADITRQAALDQLDLQKTYANALTSGSTAKAKLPLVTPDDEFAIRTALSALGGYDPDTVRIVWIQTTQDLSTLHVSEPLVDELPADAEATDLESLAFSDGTASFTRQ